LSTPAALASAGLSVHYGPVQALDGVSLEVQHGEVVALLGPSGAGKSTLLHAAAGFVVPSQGTIAIGGREVSRPGWTLPPEKRAVGLVFQSYALWPHMSAIDTVAYPLRRHGTGRRDAREAAHDWLKRLGMAELAQRRPAELSGGEQQRVGLARALASSPVLFLLDEPTANLDASLKASLQKEIRRLQRATGAGALYVTHDPAEAFAVADNVAVLRAGCLVQMGAPAEVYACPIDPWVAQLTGACSILRGIPWAAEGPHLRLTFGEREVLCRGRALSPKAATLLLRPEWVALGPPGALALESRLQLVRFQGSYTDYLLDAHGAEVLAREPGPPCRAAGQAISWEPREALVVSEDS